MRDGGIFSNVQQGLSVFRYLAADANIWQQPQHVSAHICGGLVPVIYQGGYRSTLPSNPRVLRAGLVKTFSYSQKRRFKQTCSS